ncbi:MAG: Dabb family protein [Bacteroidia bacterium]|nr:Dabb family protein [Bacteroidia bacterium]
MRNVLLFCMLGLCFGCSQQDKVRIKQLELELVQLQVENAKYQMEMALSENSPLVHMVFLNFAENQLDHRDSIIKQIERLAEIEAVKNLEIGNFEDLEDKRAFSDYELFFKMEFENAEKYAEYQAHDIHSELKLQLKSMLEAPPAIYDYLKK